MKKIYQLLIWIMAISLLSSSCERDYLLYDNSQKDAVYFDISKDSIHISYGFTPVTTYESSLKVKLMGVPKSEDRNFRLEVVKENSTAKKDLHYYLPENFVIKANDIDTTLKITFYRNKDANLLTDTVSLHLRLVESDDLKVVGKRDYKISYTNVQPSSVWWWYPKYLGEYNYDVAVKFIEYFQEMETKNKYIYDMLKGQYGEYLEKKSYISVLGGQYRKIFYKYVLIPLYDYYQENPELNVELPVDPRTLL